MADVAGRGHECGHEANHWRVDPRVSGRTNVVGQMTGVVVAFPRENVAFHKIRSHAASRLSAFSVSGADNRYPNGQPGAHVHKLRKPVRSVVPAHSSQNYDEPSSGDIKNQSSVGTPVALRFSLGESHFVLVVAIAQSVEWSSNQTKADLATRQRLHELKTFFSATARPLTSEQAVPLS